jgi:hypothetical protein
MLKTFPCPAGATRAPGTLAAVAAALVTCGHPAASHVRVSASAAMWCSSCGALRGEGEAVRWLPARLPSLLTKKHFEEVVLVLHCVRQLTLMTGGEASSGSAVHGAFRRVRASLSELARMPLVREVDRLDEAIAALSPSPVRPSESIPL